MNLLTADDNSVRASSPAPSTISSEGGMGTDSLSDGFPNSLPSHVLKRRESDWWYVGYLNMLRYASL